MSVLDYVGGAAQPRISELPASDVRPSIEVGYDGWSSVSGKGGVGFVWVLGDEM